MRHRNYTIIGIMKGVPVFIYGQDDNIFVDYYVCVCDMYWYLVFVVLITGTICR